MKRSSVLMLALVKLAMLVSAQGVPPPTAGGPLPPPIPSPVSSPIPSPILPPLSSVPKIDTHSHYVPPFYREILAAKNINSGGIAIPAWNVTAHLELNALVGIETSVVAISTPGAVLSADQPYNESRALARKVNEYGYNLTKQYPKKFLFWATLTLPDLEGSIAEAIYGLEVLGAAGVIIEASAYGELLGTPRYAPLYKVLNDRHAVVFVHPSNSPCAVAPVEYPNSTDIPSFVIDFLLDTSRAALNLVYRNVTIDYPNITFILAHSGGFLPFAATRASGGLALLAKNGLDLPIFYAELAKFNVDLAISASRTSLPSTFAYFNTSKITYGSDFPYSPVVGVVSNTEAISAYRLGGKVRKRIDFYNAYGLFKRLLKK